MKAEDLMVGDWVILYDRPRKVEIVYDNGRVQVGCIEEDCTVLEPISLTPEILLKNGFENDFYKYVSVSDYYSIRVEGYSLKGRVEGWDEYLIDFCNGSVNVLTDFHGEYRGEIDYVHTFQHALKLCGINLEIKL